MRDDPVVLPRWAVDRLLRNHRRALRAEGLATDHCETLMTLLLNAIDDRDPGATALARRWGVSRKTVYQWKTKYAHEIEVLLQRLEANKGNTQGYTEVTQIADSEPGTQVEVTKRLHQGNTPPPLGSASPPDGFPPVPPSFTPKAPSQKDSLTGIQKGFPKTITDSGGYPSPESVVLDDELLAYCRSRAPDIDPHDFLETFINQCHAKGYRYKNHRRAFQNWIKNEQRKRSQIAERGIGRPRGGGDPRSLAATRRDAYDEPAGNYQRIRDAAHAAVDPQRGGPVANADERRAGS